jgi:HD-GYP domain-containing protein (c-di-GMP phosphodiesterase class II)
VPEQTKTSPREYFGVPNADGFVPILVETLRADSMPDFDLYNRVEAQYLLYRKGELPFTAEQHRSLGTHRVHVLYVPQESIGAYWRYVQQNIALILSDPKLPPRRKAEVFHASAIGLTRGVLTHPTSRETLQTASEVVKGSAQLLMEGRQGFHAFLNMVGKDANLFSHAVNVCTYGIALSQGAGIPSDRLPELGTGLLLHDLGMVGIPEEIVNKPGSLTAGEWQIIRAHPERGIQIYVETGGRSEVAKSVIIGHHERVDGSGYPRGLRGTGIPLVARISATVNVFDALTTARPFRPALSTYAAITAMRQELRNSIDQDLLDLFIRILGPE